MRVKFGLDDPFSVTFLAARDPAQIKGRDAPRPPHYTSPIPTDPTEPSAARPSDLLAWGALGAALAEHCSDFIGLMDADGVALFLNRSVRGAPSDQVEGKRLEEFLTHDRALQVRALLEEAKRTGRPALNPDAHVIALDGSDRWFSEKCVPIEGGKIYMLVRTETTHQRQTRGELLAAEERYRVLFESNPDPVLVYAPESLELLAVNAAAEALYGWSRDELSGRTILDFYPADAREEARASLQALSDAETRDRRAVVHQICADGESRRCEIVDNPIEFHGRAARICVVRDVTEREQLEEQLRHSQKMEAIGVFAGGVAHDFNNLLAVIMSVGATAGEAAPRGSELSDDLALIMNAARRGAELTQKLLLFSRKEIVRKETVDLASVVVDFAGLLRRLVEPNVLLEIVQAHAPLPLFADRTLLEQVILNLVMNARQAMPNGGRITVSVRRREITPSDAPHPGVAPGSYAELCVTDDGVGMDADTARKVFDPFFTTKRTGTGLGLAVVHGIVAQHEGTITVDSEPGIGTTFRAQFPLTSRLYQVDTGQLRLRAPRGTERVLVAEDEPQLRYLTERSLSRLGYHVVAARNGQEALAEFEQTPDDFDLVVLDVVMPTLGGREAWDRMRARRPSLRALFVTGYAPESSGVVEVLDQPGAALLRKPFTPIELAERVRQLLDA
ncbi:MAG: PAS domain S-box protein [Polyangiaceae bacterium]|nr:PAS domain S-box protein [Polyangiaceae bacterium]